MGSCSIIVVPQKLYGLDINIITRVPGFVKYLTSLNTMGTCKTKNNGRPPGLAGGVTAALDCDIDFITT